MYTTPLAITGSKEQLEALVPKLEILGYQKAPYYYGHNNILVTNFNNENGKFSFVISSNEKEYNRTVVEADNELLVLTLAAMREGETFYPGEAVMIYAKERHNSPLLWNFKKIDFIDNDGNAFPINLVGGGAWGINENIRKATKEEIIEHYSKPQLIMTIDKPYSDESEVTYEMITTHPYFRTLSLKELEKVINFMDTKGYIKLPGLASQGRAESLMERWKTPVYKSYAVYAATHEEALELSSYQKKLFGSKDGAVAGNYYRFSPGRNDIYGPCGTGSNRKDYDPQNRGILAVEHIFDSFQTWKNYIANVEGQEATEKKIIGYKAPYDLFDGEVKAGSIFELIKNVNGVKEGMWYANGEAAKTTTYSRHLPKEIVETWEPVYEEEVKEISIIVGSPAIELTIKRDGSIFVAKYRKNRNIQLVNDLIDSLQKVNMSDGDSANKVTLKEATLHFGCSDGTDIKFSELLNIQKAYNDAFKKQ